ncbi:MAG: bifunctional phosphopantothenoylcysteine decarboxylase/phosphopantothenate--cysteine ligase CoaBC [Deltaproteobacteria bacterium]|nr:bifunctional phosphopantothenoylcysteine decarboxylase/phosphopantothenate--cysteine ligase CoaBC [Deltaproteobacteria bacterium]
MLNDSEVVLGITGGIAVYKAAELVRLLVSEGARVHVIMTDAACRFVTPLTFQTLSGNPVATELFSLVEESSIGHIALADRARVMVIAPATANTIGKISAGIADDILSTVISATRAPVLLCPAMNVHMWENPIVQANIQRLRSLGYRFAEPGAGFLACGYEGKGRMAEPADILEDIRRILTPQDLQGLKFLVTAGPTLEPLDPVRFISNRSSGKMGYALALAACRRGAEVTLVTGPTALPVPRGADAVAVETAADMQKAVAHRFERVDVVIKAAAVSDYAPREPALHKIKKDKSGPLSLELTATQDILARLGSAKKHQILVGFAAETQDLLPNARRKMEEKNLDIIVANDVTAPGSGFQHDTNQVKILRRDGSVEDLPLMPKDEVAHRVLDHVLQIRKV